MEQIKISTPADNFLLDIEAGLNSLEAEPEKKDEYLEKKIKELEKYILLRSIRESIGGEGIKELIKDNQELSDFYEQYEFIFGGNPPVFSFRELQDYSQKIKNIFK